MRLQWLVVFLVAALVPAAVGAAPSALEAFARLSEPQSAPRDPFDLQLQEADRLAAAHKGAEARSLYSAIAARAQLASRPDIQSRALEGMGRLLNGDSQYADAQSALEQALPLAESLVDAAAVARIQTTLGNVAVNRGRFSEADGWYRKAAATAAASRQRRLEATALLNICLLDITPNEEREKLHDSVERIARDLGDADLEARVWHSRGDRDFAGGNLARALEELQTAARLYEKAGNRDDLATVYTSLGRLNRAHGLPLAAIPYYEKAFEIQQKADDKIGMIQSLNASGVAFGSAGDHKKALTYYERAYKLAQESGSARAINFMRGNLAGGLLNLGQHARSAELLEALLADGGDSYPAVRHAQLADAYLRLGRLEDARRHADESMALASGTQIISSLLHRAQVLVRQGESARALDDLERAVAQIEQVRQKLVPVDFMKQGFTSQYLAVYSVMIDVYYGRGQVGRAIEVAESARARAFLDLLATRGILAPGSARPSDINQLSAAAARDRSTIVSYWTADDYVFIGVVPPSGPPRMVRVALRLDRLASLVAGVAPSSARTAGGGATGATAWKALHAALIEPIRAWLPPSGGDLTIIPHGPLMRLPFAALCDARGRYLVEDYSLRYVPAGAFLEAGLRGPGSVADRRFLFVADPRLPPPANGERPLPPLPGARSEVQAIRKLIPAGQALLLVGEQATRKAVAANMPAASVLHFATHGVVNDREPLDAYLALAESDPAPADGHLTAQALYGFHLRADLVVLSSCRSAGGQVTGEGIAALARAFLSAGVPSVVASVWDVPDQPANRLFPVLYGDWLRGQRPSDALRSAQLRLLRDLRAGRVRVSTVAGEVALSESPVLWAGFIVIGDR